MATIVIHAGRPKTGSTSIQRWIVENWARLRQQHGVQVLAPAQRTHRNPTDELRLEPYEGGYVNSSHMVESWRAAKWPPASIGRFIDDLACFADRAPIVLITGEAFSLPLLRAQESFLRGLEQLAQTHDVRVAYYVRPQHTALEANWREGGYKQRELQPSDWISAEERRLHYLRTLEGVEKLAPSVTFGTRPFVSNLLDGGSPVSDFACRFLELDEQRLEVHANPGLPLELVNLLRQSPEGWFWTSIHVETYTRESVAALFAGIDLTESPKLHRSRLILQQHCHEIFEDENQKLIRHLGWPPVDFVPPAHDLDDAWQLTELDVLWLPDASEAERSLLYQAMRAALARGTASRYGVDP